MSKVIVITGAGDGLGRALARRFARDGETVILLGRTLSKVEAVAQELGEPHFAVACDVGNPDSVRAAFAAIAQRHPKVDVLINNAAIYEPFTLAEVRDEQIAASLATNVAGPIHCAREALPLLRGGGHIINVTSESVPLKMPMLRLYAGGKAGLELMSDMWARELEPEGVRVTVVQAGMMMDETKTAAAGRWMSRSASPRKMPRSASICASAASAIIIRSPTSSAPCSTCRRTCTSDRSP